MMFTNIWTEDQDALLRRLVDLGLPHSQIAAKINARFHTRYTRNATIGRALRLDINAPTGRKESKPVLPAASDGAVDYSFTRLTSFSVLMSDTELRARIEILGVTGGLLGDPMPGRSALDRKRAGIVERPATVRGQERMLGGSYLPKPVTLPTMPWCDYARSAHA